MTQPPPSSGQFMPNGRRRPGGGGPVGPGGAPAQYRDYAIPKSYDTSVRPAGGLTAARYAPAQLQPPTQAPPASAWATQTRRVQEVTQSPAKTPVGRIVAWIAAALLGLGLLVVLGISFLFFVIGSPASFVWWPVAAFLALLSLLFIIVVMVLADRWDPQPVPLLLVAVLWGAALAVAVSFVVNSINGAIMSSVFGGPGVVIPLGGIQFSLDFAAVLSAPWVEEISKGLGLVALMLMSRRYFNGPLDGLISGALIGGGFAFTENIIYYERQVSAATQGAQEAGIDPTAFSLVNLMILVVMRGVLGIFGHVIYTSLTGLVMGWVVRKWGTLPGVLVFIVAVIPGIVLHAAWNFFSGTYTGVMVAGMFDISMIIQFALQALLSLVWLILIVVLVLDQARLTRVRLGDYANIGWLTHEEVDMLGTWKGRREGKAWARQINARPVMKRFIRESADLASVRQRLLADGANPKAVELEKQLLQRLNVNRQELLQHSG